MAVEVKQKKGGCQKCFIIFLRVLKVLSILSLLLNITAYVLGIKSCTESRTLSNLDKSYQVLSSVGFIVFSLILILSEFERGGSTACFTCCTTGSGGALASYGRGCRPTIR